MSYNVTKLGNIGTVWDINSSGQMTGISAQSAILYGFPVPGPFQVTALADWYTASIPNPNPGKALKPVTTSGAAINDSGDIAGTANIALYHPQGKRAFLREAASGPIVDLHGTLTSLNLVSTWSAATDINNGPGESINGAPMGPSVVGIGDNGPWQIWKNSATGKWTEARSLANQWNLTLPSAVNTVFINDSGSIVFDTEQTFYLYFAPGYKAYPYQTNPVKFSGRGFVYGFNNHNQVLLQPGGSGNNIILYWPSGFGYTFSNLGQIGGKPPNPGYPCYISGPRRILNDQAMNNQTNVLVPVVPPPGSPPGSSDQCLYTQFTTSSTVQSSTVDLSQSLGNSNTILGTVLGINKQGWIVGQDANNNTVLLTPQ